MKEADWCAAKRCLSFDIIPRFLLSNPDAWRSSGSSVMQPDATFARSPSSSGEDKSRKDERRPSCFYKTFVMSQGAQEAFDSSPRLAAATPLILYWPWGPNIRTPRPDLAHGPEFDTTNASSGKPNPAAPVWMKAVNSGLR